MTVLDASAVLALVHDEPGAGVVSAALAGSVIGAANLAEVLTADRAWAELALPVRVQLIR